MGKFVCTVTLISALALLVSCRREAPLEVREGEASAAPDLLTLRGFRPKLEQLGGAQSAASAIQLRLVPTAIEIADNREALVLSLDVDFQFAFGSGAENVKASRTWELRTRQGHVVVASGESERVELAVGDSLGAERIEIHPPEDGYYHLLAEAYAYVDGHPQDMEGGLFFAVSNGEIRSAGISEWITNRRSLEFQDAFAAPQYFPRDPGEWQGRRMRLFGHRACTQASHCRGAQACADGICTGCSQSSQCLATEECVLDHCLPKIGVECVNRDQCPEGQLCHIFPFGSGPRDNAGATSTCE